MKKTRISACFLAETERFELSYAGEGVTAFRVRLVATTSIRFHNYFREVDFFNPLTQLSYYITLILICETIFNKLFYFFKFILNIQKKDTFMQIT